MTRAAIFDLDGTLADTSGDLIAAANACFEKDWLDADADRLTAFAGGRAMLRLAVMRRGGVCEEAEVEAAFPRFVRFYEACIDARTTLYPGVEAALDGLAAADWKLGICTNKPEVLARKLLVSLGIMDRFGALIGVDTLPVCKPDPATAEETLARLGCRRERAVFIGDTKTDHDTARNAGIPFVLYSGDPATVCFRGFTPDAIVDEYAGMQAVLDDFVPVLQAAPERV